MGELLPVRSFHFPSFLFLEQEMSPAEGERRFDLQIAIITNNVNKIDEIINEIGYEAVSNSIRLINRSTPVSLAIYRNNQPALDRLLLHPINLNRLSCDYLGRVEPPLCSAIRLNNTSIVNKLLSFQSINVNQTDNCGQTPLWWAAQMRRFDIVQSVVGHESFKITHPSFKKSRTSPVYLAAKYLKRGREEMFKFLIESGLPYICIDTDHGGDDPEIDVTYIDGQTVLFEVAVVHHAYHFIQHLINAGMEIHCFRDKFANPIIRQSIKELHPRSLAAECRLKIRRKLNQDSNSPINEKLVEEHYPFLPKKLVKYLCELS